MTQATQENPRVLALKRGERATEGVLGPALRIGLDRVREETVEGSEQFGHQPRQAEFANQVSSLGDDIVIAIRQHRAQGFDARLGRLVAKLVERRELLFNTAFARHGMVV